MNRDRQTDPTHAGGRRPAQPPAPRPGGEPPQTPPCDLCRFAEFCVLAVESHGETAPCTMSA